MMLFFLAIALLALSYLLSRATDVLVIGINQLSQGTAFEAYGLTTFLVALATSLPELFVGVASALEGESTLPLGVVVGSNIANVSLVIGGAALVSGLVRAENRVFKKDILYAFLVGCLPLLMLLDKELSRLDGAVLLLVYIFFVVVTMTRRKRRRLKQVEEEYYEDADLSHKVLRVLGKKDVEQGMLRLVLGSAALIVCADLIVRLSSLIADLIHIPIIIVGLFMVSVGATLPEFTFELKTIGRKEYLMTFGNIVGSVVANSSLILGTVAVLAPVRLGQGSTAYFASVIAFVVVFSMFWWFTYSKKMLERWEGAALVAAYFVFILVQMRLL